MESVLSIPLSTIPATERAPDRQPMLAGTTSTLHFLNGRIDGVRTVRSRTSPLVVFAGPWADLGELLANGLPGSHGIYCLTGPMTAGRLAARPGEASDLRRRLLEHASDPTKSAFAEVFALAAVDDRLDKSSCRYLEARVHEIIAAQPGRVLEVERMPLVPDLARYERDTLEAILEQARTLMYVAGCRALDAPHLPFEPAGPEKEEGLVEVQADVGASYEDEHELLYDSVWARGHPAGEGFVIRAGSDIRIREGAAQREGVSARRRLLLAKGVLGVLPNVHDRWRLLSNVWCSSALLAAKVVTGAHLSRPIWQRISPQDRLVVAK